MTPKWLSTKDLDLMLNAAGPDSKRRVLAHIAALLEEHARELDRWEERYRIQGEEVARLHEVLSLETPANNLRGEIARLREEHRKVLAEKDAETARHLRTISTLIGDEFKKSLARARNEGLERAAAKADAVAEEARRRRDAIDTNTPMGRTGYTIAETAMDAAGVLADDIRALKEPEE